MEGRAADKQTDRQTDRQTGTETETDGRRDRKSMVGGLGARRDGGIGCMQCSFFFHVDGVVVVVGDWRESPGRNSIVANGT